VRYSVFKVLTSTWGRDDDDRGVAAVTASCCSSNSVWCCCCPAEEIIAAVAGLCLREELEGDGIMNQTVVWRHTCSKVQ
jgi:hypothetical protein